MKILGKVNSLIPIEEELSYIKDYIFIQKNRFPEQFGVEIDVIEDSKSLRVHDKIVGRQQGPDGELSANKDSK